MRVSVLSLVSSFALALASPSSSVPFRKMGIHEFFFLLRRAIRVNAFRLYREDFPMDMPFFGKLPKRGFCFESARGDFE